MNLSTWLMISKKNNLPISPVPRYMYMVSAGGSHSLGIRNGKLFAWGRNGNGRTGLGTDTGNTLTPTQVE